MIKFFRKIRQKMLTQSKFSNYFFYAFGEIILVVIGILIALQINNWNENRKNILTESVYLKELQEDFEINLEKSNNSIAGIEEALPRLIGLLEQSALENPTISIDSLNKDCAFISSMRAYFSTDRTYNNLIGSGDFKLITSADLKSAIADYYKALDILKLVQSTHEMDLVNAFQPYIIEFLDYQAIPWMRVNDYPLPPPVEENRILKVLKDQKFRNIITLKMHILADLLDLNRSIQQINTKVVKLLKEQTNQ